ncbi:MAG: hypothetical protein ACFE96_16065 [Candidatus Hermodarchaeota archaeon]
MILAIPVLIVIFGIVGIVKDRVVAMAIIGLNLGLGYAVLLLFGFITNFLSSFSPYI